MKDKRCGDCRNFCTDACPHREDVDTSTRNCPCHEEKPERKEVIG